MASLIPFALCLVAAAAWPQAPPPLTVEDAVSLAIRQNPRLAASGREVSAAEDGVRAARALTNPEIFFVPGITSSAGSDEELLVQQPLEVNGTRRARAAVAAARLERTQAEAVGGLRTLILETKVAYYELLRAQRLRALAEEALGTAEELDRGVRRQVEEGLKPGVDQIQTAVQVSRARQHLTVAQSQVKIAASALNTLMGRPPEASVGTLPALEFSETPVDRDAALQQALSARADLAAAEAQRQAFAHEARLARAEGRPDVVPHLRAESVVRGLHGVGLGVGISLPFVDHGSRRSRLRQAEKLGKAQEARLEAARSQVKQEVEQALLRLQTAEVVIQEYQRGVLEQARQLLDANTKGFQLGAPGTSVLTVLEAQRTYRAVQTEYANALVDHAIAHAELERATGAAPAKLPMGRWDRQEERNER